MINHYETLTGRRLALDKLPRAQRQALNELIAAADRSPDWVEFSSLWQRVLTSALSKLAPKERVRHVLYRVAQDLELRLGIAQGAVAPPDYRDYILDRIEDKFGSRYKFCQTTGLSEAFLSQVLSGQKNFSLEKLREVARALDLELALLPAADIASIPVTDLTALRRVGAILSDELATLQSLRTHLGRIKPEKRLAALKNERKLMETVVDRLLARLSVRPEAERGETLSELIDEDIRSAEAFLRTLFERIAEATEPTVDRSEVLKRCHASLVPSVI